MDFPSLKSHFCKRFLNTFKSTVLMLKVGIIFFFLDDLDLFSHILGIWVAEKITVSSSTEPIIACFKLIIVIFIVITFWLFFDKSICIVAFASQREISSCVFVSRLNVLIVSSISWELRRVGS